MPMMRRILAMLVALCLVGYGQTAIAGVHTHDLATAHDVQHATLFGGQRLSSTDHTLASHEHNDHHHADHADSSASGERQPTGEHYYQGNGPDPDAIHEHVVHAHGCASMTLVDPTAEFSAVLPTRGPRSFGVTTYLKSLVATPPLRPPIQNL